MNDAAAPTPPILVIEHVTRSFGGVRAVNDCSLVVPQGGITGLIGPNGAGKTTLFNTITGFLKPDTGHIYFQGERIDGLTQEPDQQGKPLTGELTGYRSLRAVGQRYRIIYQVERQRVLVLILMVGLRTQGDRADVYRLAQKLIHLKLV